MSKGIDISVAADTRSAMSALNRGLLDPLEDVAEALDRLGDDSDEATRELERGFRDSQRTTEKAADAIKEVSDELNNAGRAKRHIKEVDDALERVAKSGKTAGKGIKDGMDDADDSVKEFKSEAVQNFSEVASSFSGDMSSAADLVQGTFGGLASGISGPLGIALGGAALGVGLVTSALTSQQEAADELKNRLAGVYQAAAEAGRDYLDTSQLIAETHDLMFNPDRAEEYKTLVEDANRLSIDQQVLIAATAGDLDSQAQVIAHINALQEENARLIEEAGGATGEYLSAESALQTYENKWQAINDATEANAQKARDAQKYTDNFLKSAIEKAGTATEEVDALGNKLYTLPNDEQILIEAKTGQATKDLSAFQGDLDATPETVTTTAKFAVDDWALRNYRAPTIWVESRVLAPRDGRQVF